MSLITQLLLRVNRGESGAMDELMPLIYDELWRQARACLGNNGIGKSLPPTALVHEAFLKLAGNGGGDSWQNSRHFYNAAAEVMRQILVSHARRRLAFKRGGGAHRVPLDESDLATEESEEPDWEALDRALAELKQRDERRYRVVMLRYFAGLTDAQVAQALEVSEKTVERDWATAKVFLRARMAG